MPVWLHLCVLRQSPPSPGESTLVCTILWCGSTPDAAAASPRRMRHTRVHGSAAHSMQKSDAEPDEIILAERPVKAGKLGRATQLVTNFYAANFSKVPPLYHHDIRVHKMKWVPGEEGEEGARAVVCPCSCIAGGKCACRSACSCPCCSVH
jgi:hypothetical protein